MYVKTFKMGVIVFIGNMIMCLMSHWVIIFSIKSLSVDYRKISLNENKEKLYNQ